MKALVLLFSLLCLSLPAYGQSSPEIYMFSTNTIATVTFTAVGPIYAPSEQYPFYTQLLESPDECSGIIPDTYVIENSNVRYTHSRFFDSIVVEFLTADPGQQQGLSFSVEEMDDGYYSGGCSAIETRFNSSAMVSYARYNILVEYPNQPQYDISFSLDYRDADYWVGSLPIGDGTPSYEDPCQHFNGDIRIEVVKGVGFDRHVIVESYQGDDEACRRTRIFEPDSGGTASIWALKGKVQGPLYDEYRDVCPIAPHKRINNFCDVLGPVDCVGRFHVPIELRSDYEAILGGSWEVPDGPPHPAWHVPGWPPPVVGFTYKETLGGSRSWVLGAADPQVADNGTVYDFVRWVDDVGNPYVEDECVTLNDSPLYAGEIIEIEMSKDYIWSNNLPIIVEAEYQLTASSFGSEHSASAMQGMGVGNNHAVASSSVEASLESEHPDRFDLTAAYPNPFNPTTNFTLSAPRQQHVDIALYDVMGRRVQTIFSGQMAAGERREFTISAGELPSGLYVYRAIGGGLSASRSVVLAK